jgi:WD40 repeat protein
MTANLDKLKLVKTISRREIVFSVARVPHTGRLFFGGSDGAIHDLDLAVAKPEPQELGKHNSYVTGVALANTAVVSGGYDGRLIWWDIRERKQIRAVAAHQKWIRAVVATRDGRIVASVADDMVCRLWDAPTGKLLHELRGHQETTPHHFPSMLYACALSPDGKHVATGDKIGHVVIWQVDTGKSIATLEVPALYTWDPTQRRHSIGGIRALAFSPDGKWLAVGGIGKVANIDHLDGKARVEVFDWQRGTRTHEFSSDKFNGLVERLAFHPQNDWLVAAGGANDGFLLFFDLKVNKAVRQDKAPMFIHDLVLNEGGDTIYAAGHHQLAVYETSNTHA